MFPKNNQIKFKASQLVCTPPLLRDENDKKSVTVCPGTRVPGQEKEGKKERKKKVPCHTGDMGYTGGAANSQKRDFIQKSLLEIC